MGTGAFERGVSNITILVLILSIDSSFHTSPLDLCKLPQMVSFIIDRCHHSFITPVMSSKGLSAVVKLLSNIDIGGEDEKKGDGRPVSPSCVTPSPRLTIHKILRLCCHLINLPFQSSCDYSISISSFLSSLSFSFFSLTNTFQLNPQIRTSSFKKQLGLHFVTFIISQ